MDSLGREEERGVPDEGRTACEAGGAAVTGDFQE